MARKLEEIQQEYNVLCAQLGQAVYRIEALEMEQRGAEKDAERLKRQLKKVNIEAAQAQGKDIPAEVVSELAEVPSEQSTI